ncbi:pyridoxamine 5'-phosphate oxidase-domain-containing protein [Mycena rebaudengoi]|nr:pyridoxamine 5'-phosphate oxidase-domain-containing protein [Mycena rebaudengoi]
MTIYNLRLCGVVRHLSQPTHMAVPRWKTAITSALAKHDKLPVIQCASIDPSTPVPHVRCLIFRLCMGSPRLCSLSCPPQDDPSHPLLVLTTDVRTPKTAQMIANPHVQVVWWFDSTQEQYRIAGRAHIIPAPGHALHKHFIHSVQALSHGAAFDWEAKRQEVFRSMTAERKASWCRPVPGSRLEGGQEEAKKWPVEFEEPKEGDEEGKRNWETALSNFALIVIEPTDVDYVELGPVPNQRTRFWMTAKGEWTEEELVP